MITMIAEFESSSDYNLLNISCELYVVKSAVIRNFVTCMLTTLLKLVQKKIFSVFEILQLRAEY